MIDLMLTLHLTHEEVARALSAIGIGPFPAIIASVIFPDRFGNQKTLVMAVSQMVSAAAVFCVPFTNNVHNRHLNDLGNYYFTRKTTYFSDSKANIL